VDKFARAHGLQRVPGPDPQYEDVCFGGAPQQHDDLEGLSRVFPSMEIQFDQVRAVPSGFASLFSFFLCFFIFRSSWGR
jgi:hypothetical protein